MPQLCNTLANLTQNPRPISCLDVWFFDLSPDRKLVAGRHLLTTFQQKANFEVLCHYFSSKQRDKIPYVIKLHEEKNAGNSSKWLMVFSYLVLRSNLPLVTFAPLVSNQVLPPSILYSTLRPGNATFVLRTPSTTLKTGKEKTRVWICFWLLGIFIIHQVWQAWRKNVSLYYVKVHLY